jgi:hypothetical protein
MTSVETTSMYEAGGNLLWADMNLGAASRNSEHVINEEPSMQQVIDYAEQFFTLKGGGVSPSMQLSLVYPDVLETVVADVNALFSGGAPSAGKTLPSKVNLVAGHPLLFAWYWSAGLALRDNDLVRVRALWQCALSCTIRVRLSSDPKELIVATMQISEKYTGFQKGMTDNFVTWSKKVMKIAEPNASAAKVATALASKSISYAGAKTSKQMILAAQTITANLDETCYADLRMLEREFGRDILTAGYIKLPKLIQTCKGMLDTQSFTFKFSFVIRMMVVTLRQQLVTPSWFTIATMDNKAVDGEKTAGWIAMTVAKSMVVKHLFSLMKTMDNDDGKK